MVDVIIVEDDADIRASVAEILRDEGYVVAEYEDGQKALSALETGLRPCLVIIDLLMPRMSGEQFAAAVRGNDRLASIPVVMITGASTPPSGIEVLRKPFELDALLRIVARHCSHAAPAHLV
jgi:CheY-like chemotaxis protein